MSRGEGTSGTAAKSRSFDIGIEAPRQGTGPITGLLLVDEAIRAAAEVDAQIAICVYGADENCEAEA